MSDEFKFETPLSPMRFQAQLGKEMKRMYKEGQNVVRLSFARVIKVNYKYNTVDVMTTLHKNTTTKNPSDNGKFSARLPIALGGRTPEGKVYGATTLVTVGTLVLIGFIEGNKDYPIVLNIYGDTDNQSQLTRTTLTSADESDKDVQQELWQLFNLYPSMTYQNIDGRGNQEITFSGKSFMYITDTDPDNFYVQDGAFDYEDLPSSRYANGSLIEPVSPHSPTLLYVHQGIYDKHRVTFFIKSDGTLRIGSRHIEGEGITFQELKTDGSFAVVQKKDTNNPDEESNKFSKFEITESGDLVLQSANHTLEIKESGVLIDGEPLASSTSADFAEVKEEVADIQLHLDTIDEELDTKVSKVDYTVDLDSIREYTQSLISAVALEVRDISDNLTSLETFLEEAFEDGTIQETEASTINTYISILAKEKADLDNKYLEISADKYLPEESKMDLSILKGNYDSEHEELIQTIEIAIEDNSVTFEEVQAVSAAITEFTDSLNALNTAFAAAIDAITLAKIKEATDNAIGYVDGEIRTITNAISQLAEQVNKKVESTTFNNTVATLATKTETEAITERLDTAELKIIELDDSVPYKAEITSSNGIMFKNGVSTTLLCRVYRGPEDIATSLPASSFVWRRVSADAAKDSEWYNSHVGVGRIVTLTKTDVTDRATFTCEITIPKDGESVIVTTAQVTITDLSNINEVIVSTTAPTTPKEGMVWLNSSGSAPYRIYTYKSSAWVSTDYESLSALDKDSYDKLIAAYNTISDLEADNKVTKFERSIVREDLAKITGVYLSGTDTMPTLTQIDANAVGDLYGIRKAAVDVGILTSSTNYTLLGDAYAALRTYLSGTSIKAWDTSTAGTVTVVAATWDSKWRDYYAAYRTLATEIDTKRKNYVDEATKGTQSLLDNGIVSVTPIDVDTPTSLDIAFGTTFPSAPTVMLTTHTAQPGTIVKGVSVDPGSITTTGCKVWVTSTNTEAVSVAWLAMLKL